MSAPERVPLTIAALTVSNWANSSLRRLTELAISASASWRSLCTVSVALFSASAKFRAAEMADCAATVSWGAAE